MKKFACFNLSGDVFWALVEGNNVFRVIDSIYSQTPEINQKPININKLKIVAPFEGNKVIGLGYNYKGLVGRKSHFDEPLIFLKSPESVVAHKGDVIYPEYCKKIWIETELTIIIGKKGKNIPLSQTNEYILGYTCGNDITAENIHDRDWHLAVSKGLDTFAPVGPYLIQGIDTNDLEIYSSINGKITQRSRTSDRILNNQECVALVSKYFTLNPGDIIMTGTPAGATDAIVQPGDEVIVEIENIGRLKNYIIKK
jgi:2-keto-4-pentenoate hydratase/2-oxohepta-3-ene-1,7-dioic acid hydratase in catechol pathway